MISILNEISKFRKEAPLVIDYKNTNRHRVVIIESDGSKTAYYFAVPIYNITTRKVIDVKFHPQGDAFYATGSNANITITENIKMENTEGTCLISLPPPPACASDSEISCGREKLYPTTNGVAIRSSCNEEEPYIFSVELQCPHTEMRANDRCLAFMSEKFTPFVVISCIGTEDKSGNIISPAKLSYQRISDQKYTVSIEPYSPMGCSVLTEINLYEPKLFQDTTVESKNMNVNNAFGSVGFIGTTKEYGEQWLYSRTNISKIAELNDNRIVRVVVHIPQLSESSIPLTAWGIAARFCSFGSTWENKKAADGIIADVQACDKYINLDITTLFTDNYGRLSYNEGFILKPKSKNSGFSVLSTGDSHLHPQILEINYM